MHPALAAVRRTRGGVRRRRAGGWIGFHRSRVASAEAVISIDTLALWNDRTWGRDRRHVRLDVSQVMFRLKQGPSLVQVRCASERRRIWIGKAFDRPAWTYDQNGRAIRDTLVEVNHILVNHPNAAR